MNYMDWADIRQAAVEAGLDESDGSAAAVGIIMDLLQYADQQGESPDRNQPPSREEAIAQLERDLEKSVSAAPSEMVLSSAGE